MNTSTSKILIVDDEMANTDAIKDILEDVNYKVYCAHNADKAKQILTHNSFNLIIIDVWMPGQDGMSLLQELINHNITAKIIMMSGHAAHSDVVSAIKIGAVNFVKKPIQDVLLLVRDALNDSYTNKVSNTCNYNLNVSFKKARTNFEKKYLQYHLKNNNNNITKVAKIADMERTTLYRKIKELGIKK